MTQGDKIESIDFDKYEAPSIESPYDEYELHLIDQIEQIKKSYMENAKPYLDRLVQSRMLKTPKTILIRKQQPQPEGN